MLSRDADACYWIGRYVERAEATARMVDVHYHASLESGRTVLTWKSLLTIADGLEDFRKRYPGGETDAAVLEFFLFDRANPDSIVSTWSAARENARSIREQLSSEMWIALNVFFLELQNWNVRRILEESPAGFLGEVRRASHLFQGVLNRTMLFGEARDWLDAGRFLERADQTGRLLDVKYHDLLPKFTEGDSLGETEPFGIGGPLDTHGWIAALKSVGAFEMFRKTHRDGITPANVTSFLALNANFPASVRHGVKRVEGCLIRIRAGDADRRFDEPERLAVRLLNDLAYAQADQIIARGLHQFLVDVQRRIEELGNSIRRTYLT